MLYVFLGKKFLEYQAYIVERNKFNREFKTIKDKIHTFYTLNFLFLRGTTAPVFLSRRHPYCPPLCENKATINNQEYNLFYFN